MYGHVAVTPVVLSYIKCISYFLLSHKLLKWGEVIAEVSVLTWLSDVINVESWLESWESEDSLGGELALFKSHHPWSSLDKSLADAVSDLKKDVVEPTY